MAPSRPPLKDSIVIYDDECRLCVSATFGIERMQRDEGSCGMRFVPYKSREAAQALGKEYRPGRPDVAFLVRPDGRVDRGLSAFLPLLPGLRGGRIALALLQVPFLRRFAEVAYRQLARHRYRLFGQVAPPSDPPNRS